jgi:hypothetical protein
MQVLRPHLERYLLDYRLLKAIFLPKQSEEKSASLGQQDRTSVIAAHTDPTIVDEDRYRSLVFWTALCDVDENNGCLWVVRGSHRDTPRLRCFPFTNLMKYANDILENTPNAQQSLPMKAGTIMMFHPGLLHGSGPNFSGNARIAIQGTAMPVEAEHLHLRLRDDGRIARFRVADDHGLTYAMPEFDELGELIDVRDPV